MKDIVYIENSYTVSVREFGFRFYNFIDKKELFFAFDEVEMFIFDNPKCYLSSTFINTCITKKIHIIFCDINHNPHTEIVTLQHHKNRLLRIQSQMVLTQKLKNRLWKKIAVTKVKNQGRCLEVCSNGEKDYNRLFELSNEIIEGDKNNYEAVAARYYFSQLFGSDFVRGRYQDPINAGLNYGYAVLRSCIKKELTIHGFELSFGIHHHSSENPYNLADDFIECYRPFVDGLVYDYIYKQGCTEFTTIHKKQMVNVLMEKCLIDKKICTISDAIKMSVNSYISCLNDKSIAALLLPTMLEAGR
ncbi:type II CRISPR-associated endonuclease Cas1 [Macrococcus capreoli]